MADDILDEITADRRRRPSDYPSVAAELDIMLLHRPTGLRGRLRRFTADVVELRDTAGRDHSFRNRPGVFAHNGETVTLVRRARAEAESATRRSRSGAIVDVRQTARVAKASRLWVEGDHDARMLERVWGDELRELGIVVESLGGLDNAAAAVARFSPGANRRLVILADHLVDGSKESRIAAGLRSDFVHVVGHDHIDIWECVRPVSLGIDQWPTVPRGEDWKTGACKRLGWGTPQQGWQRVLGAVNSFADLEPTLVRAVESALDLLADS